MYFTANGIQWENAIADEWNGKAAIPGGTLWVTISANGGGTGKPVGTSYLDFRFRNQGEQRPPYVGDSLASAMNWAENELRRAWNVGRLTISN
jgi:hypothetical protein